MQKSEVIETVRSFDEIRSEVIKHTDKYPSFFESLTFKAKRKYLHKMGDNYITLMAVNLFTAWPFIELELRKNIHPRLKIKYQGYVIIWIFWVFILLTMLILIFNAYFSNSLSDIDTLIPITFLFLLLTVIPFWMHRVQRSFKNWLTNLLK